MQYFSINYSALKEYVKDKKDKFNLIDVLYLLESGFINQQQYEDLATIVAIPMYNYNSFLLDDKGYYHQQGPLSIIQNKKDLIASSSRKKRLIKKVK